METWEWGISPYTHIDHPGRVAPAQVAQHRSLIEVCQHGHVFDHVILRRIHLLEVVLFYCYGLKGRKHGIRPCL